MNFSFQTLLTTILTFASLHWSAVHCYFYCVYTKKVPKLGVLKPHLPQPQKSNSGASVPSRDNPHNGLSFVVSSHLDQRESLHLPMRLHCHLQLASAPSGCISPELSAHNSFRISKHSLATEPGMRSWSWCWLPFQYLRTLSFMVG